MWIEAAAHLHRWPGIGPLRTGDHLAWEKWRERAAPPPLPFFCLAAGAAVVHAAVVSSAVGADVNTFSAWFAHRGVGAFVGIERDACPVLVVVVLEEMSGEFGHERRGVSSRGFFVEGWFLLCLMGDFQFCCLVGCVVAGVCVEGTELGYISCGPVCVVWR